MARAVDLTAMYEAIVGGNFWPSTPANCAQKLPIQPIR